MKKKMRGLFGICLIIVIAIVIAYAQRRTSISKVNTKDEVIEHLISVEKVEQELNKENLEEAKQVVQQVESYLKQDYVNYNDLIYYNYQLVKAKLAELNGELEEAIDIYKAVYQGESRQPRNIH